MSRVLKEPLVHFLILGGALFVLFEFIGKEEETVPGESDAAVDEIKPRSISERIVVSETRIESLAAQFRKVWQRSPTDQEIAGLIDEFVREEVMYRQALKLELDRDDPMVRRRLRQKLEFFTSDLADLAEPTDGDLIDYLNSHPDGFQLEPKFTFMQVYLNPEKHADSFESDIDSLLATLRAEGESADISEAGDSLLLDQAFTATTLHEIKGMFGQEFAQNLVDLEPRRWQGPVKSGFGIHLVFVSAREEGGLRPLDEIRTLVERDWRAAKREESNEAVYQDWRSEYNITIEKPSSKEGAAAE